MPHSLWNNTIVVHVIFPLLFYPYLITILIYLCQGGKFHIDSYPLFSLSLQTIVHLVVIMRYHHKNRECVSIWWVLIVTKRHCLMYLLIGNGIHRIGVVQCSGANSNTIWVTKIQQQTSIDFPVLEMGGLLQGAAMLLMHKIHKNQVIQHECY